MRIYLAFGLSLVVNGAQAQSAESKPLVLPNFSQVTQAPQSDSKPKLKFDAKCTTDTHQDLKRGEPGYDTCLANSTKNQPTKK